LLKEVVYDELTKNEGEDKIENFTLTNSDIRLRFFRYHGIADYSNSGGVWMHIFPERGKKRIDPVYHAEEVVFLYFLNLPYIIELSTGLFHYEEEPVSVRNIRLFEEDPYPYWDSKISIGSVASIARDSTRPAFNTGVYFQRPEWFEKASKIMDLALNKYDFYQYYEKFKGETQNR